MVKFNQLARPVSDRQRWLALWVGLLISASFGTLGATLAAGYTVRQPITVAVLAVLAMAVERETVRFTAYCEASIGSLVFVFAAVTLGPLAAVIVGAGHEWQQRAYSEQPQE